MNGNAADDQQVLPKLEIAFDLIPTTLNEPFTSDFAGIQGGLVRAVPGGMRLYPKFTHHVQDLYNFELRKDDVWILSFPKSGTHWTSELAWLLLNNLDTELAEKTNIHKSVLFFEAQCFDPPTTTLQDLDELPSPRIFKTHIPFYMLPPKILDTCKIIYVARNVKDVIVSYFNHHKRMKHSTFTGDIGLYVNYFMNDEVLYAPYFNHVLDAWSRKNHPNMLFLFYEDMKQNLKKEVIKTADFLNKSLTDDQAEKLSEFLKFNNSSKKDKIPFLQPISSEYANDMRPEDSIFYRKGKTGDWKNNFSREINERIDHWIELKMAGSDLKFVTELENQD